MPRSVVYALRSVLGVRVPPSTLYGCIIYSNVGVSLSVYYFGCGRPEHQSGRSQAPTLFVL